MGDQRARQAAAGSTFTALRLITICTLCGNPASISKVVNNSFNTLVRKADDGEGTAALTMSGLIEQGS